MAMEAETRRDVEQERRVVRGVHTQIHAAIATHIINDFVRHDTRVRGVRNVAMRAPMFRIAFEFAAAPIRASICRVRAKCDAATCGRQFEVKRFLVHERDPNLADARRQH